MNRTYATLATDGATANLRFTLDEQELKCPIHPEAFSPVPNAWGRQGWTMARLDALADDELAAVLETAWRHAVPKRRR